VINDTHPDFAAATDAYRRGYAAGYREAAERHQLGDADGPGDAETWFTAPASEPNGDYEDGCVDGFGTYFGDRLGA